MRAAYFLKQAFVNSLSNSGGSADASTTKVAAAATVAASASTPGAVTDENDGNDEKTSEEVDDAEQRDLQDAIIQALSNGLGNELHGSLMRHEYAYVLGQLRDDRCCPALEDALSKDGDCVMVRHEAAEALGAIGAERSRSVLQDVVEKNPDTPELSDTCRLALNVMDWRIRGDPAEPAPAACACMLNPYSSVDPAPPHPSHENKSEAELGAILLDDDIPIFDRYRAMFSLRNRGGSAAVRELGRALVEDTSSALLRHEVAYVLGQMQHPDSISALTESLSRQSEHMMVRHESAEALGAIDGGDWFKIEATLEQYCKDDCVAVAESCVVALDAADYWGHSSAPAGGDNSDEAVHDESKETESGAVISFRDQKNLLEGKGGPAGVEDATMSSAPRNPQVLAGHFNVLSS